MRLGVVGSRYFNNYKLLETELNKIKKLDTIVSGGCRVFDHVAKSFVGADYLAEVYAISKGINLTVYPANWYIKGEYNKVAGILRNKTIVKDVDEVIAFWDGLSKGTASTINLAEKLNKKVTIIKFWSTNNEQIK
jgi:hypothetical protein